MSIFKKKKSERHLVAKKINKRARKTRGFRENFIGPFSYCSLIYSSFRNLWVYKVKQNKTNKIKVKKIYVKVKGPKKLQKKSKD